MMDILTVLDTGHTVRVMPGTADSSGATFEITPQNSPPRLVRATRNGQGQYDLLWLSYVGRGGMKKIYNPVSDGDRAILANYFKANDIAFQPLRLIPPPAEDLSL